MPGNQRPGSDVRGGALGDPRDTVKAVLLEVQSPAMELRILRNDVWNRCPRPAAALKHSCRNLQDAGATPSEGVEGDEWATYIALSRMAETNVGSPKGRES
jgi:hypothetical protein